MRFPFNFTANFFNEFYIVNLLFLYFSGKRFPPIFIVLWCTILRVGVYSDETG